jgi:hypothetical protein
MLKESMRIDGALSIHGWLLWKLVLLGKVVYTIMVVGQGRNRRRCRL